MGSVVSAQVECGYAVPLQVLIHRKEVAPDIDHVPGVRASRCFISLRVAAHVMELQNLGVFTRFAGFVVPHEDEHKVEQLSAPADILVDKITVHHSLVRLQTVFDRFDDFSAFLVLLEMPSVLGDCLLQLSLFCEQIDGLFGL
jgi:hypothetical protein